MAATVLALGLGACAGGTETVTESAPPSGGAEGAGSSTTPVTTRAGSPAGAPEPAIAQRSGSVDGERVRLEIVRFRRSGPTVDLTVRLVAEGESESGLGAQVSQDLSDGEIAELADGDTEDASAFDGPQLIDTKNRKLHLVARDGTGRCVCDTDLGSRFVKPEAPVVLSATLGAPPADVRRMDVRIPSFGTFENVPLS